MLWVAALLSSIIWVLGLTSGFLGFGVHIFLLAALIAGLAALLPPPHHRESAARAETGPPHASSVPAPEAKRTPIVASADNDERGE